MTINNNIDASATQKQNIDNPSLKFFFEICRLLKACFELVIMLLVILILTKVYIKI